MRQQAVTFQSVVFVYFQGLDFKLYVFQWMQLNPVYLLSHSFKCFQRHGRGLPFKRVCVCVSVDLLAESQFLLLASTYHMHECQMPLIM